MTSKARVLVVEDDEAVRRTLVRVLGRTECEVLQSGDGGDGLRRARELHPDLILLDVGLPAKSGLEVLRELRRGQDTSAIPVIMLTGLAGLSDKVEGFNLGADDYVTKPFAVEELSARVESILRRVRRDRAANPLTRLPGSPDIEAETCRRIREGIPFAFHYADMDHFKAFNDAYGFERGDRLIECLAACLTDSIAMHDGGAGFAGHVGGDDFVAITSPQAAPFVAQSLCGLFDERRSRYYSAEDLARGFIRGHDRQGRPETFPFVTLSVGVVTTSCRVLDRFPKVVALASEMKMSLKAGPPRRLSSFAFDRRSDLGVLRAWSRAAGEWLTRADVLGQGGRP
ncbi:MAG: response regulator [Elusimicrobia bacterium]|nr:response regulator [Elusimicrobiota bacterium]